MELPLKIELRKERDFGEKLNASFTFFIQNLKPLIKCFMYVSIPVAIVGAIALGMYNSNMVNYVGDNLQQTNTGLNKFSLSNFYRAIFAPTYFLALFCIGLSSLLTHCLTYGFIKVYLEDKTQSITIDKVWSHIRGKVVSILLYSLLLAVLILLGTVFFLIPGIYLMIVFTLFIPVVIFENKNLSEAMSRCFFLIKDKWWQTAGLLFVIYMITALAKFIFEVPQLAVSMLSMLKLIGENFPALHIFAGLISILGGLIIQSILSITIALQYFSLVENKEGLGLRQMIDKIGVEIATKQGNEGEF